MAQKITLIEYDEDIYAGDDMDPDIQHRDFISCVSGKEKSIDDVEVKIEEVARRIEDMRNYAYGISSSSSAAPEEELFEHHETGGDDSYTIGQTSYSVKLAQTFTPDIAHEITKVELELFDNQGDGITGDIDVEIKATDANGLPTGAALASGTIDAADLEPAHYSDEYNDVYLDTEIDNPSYVRSVYFSPDGYYLFILSYYGKCYRFALSTAWDITTASASGTVLLQSSLSLPALYFGGLYFKDDGYALYIVGSDVSLSSSWIFQIDLSTAWDLSTASYSSKMRTTFTQRPYHASLRFNDDGSKYFLLDGYSSSTNDAIFEFSMTTPWDITTAVTTPNQSLSIGAYDTGPCGFCFSGDGKKVVVMGGVEDKILQWNLPTGFSLVSESKDSSEIDTSGIVVNNDRDIFCNSQVNKYWLIDTGGIIYEIEKPKLRGDWHECELTGEAELDAATKYAVEASYEDYEEGVSEPEWVNNADGDDNYEAGSMLRYDGSNWFDS